MHPTKGQGAPAQVAAKETAARSLVPVEFPVSLPLSMPTMQAYIHCSIWTTVLFVFCPLQINKQGNEVSLKRQTITTCLVIIRA